MRDVNPVRISGRHILFATRTCVPGHWSIRVEHPSGHTQYTTYYEPGRVGYDVPELVPQRVKDRVRTFYKELLEAS